MPPSVDSPAASPAINNARFVMLFDPGTRTSASIGRVTGSIRTESDDKLAILEQQFAVGPELAAISKVANHVPMHGGLICAARFRITGADCHVHGAADLLVEEDVLGEALDVVVRADREFTENSGPAVGLEHSVEIFLALGRGRVDNFALFEPQHDPFDLASGCYDGIAEGDRPVDAVFNRTGKYFAVG